MVLLLCAACSGSRGAGDGTDMTPPPVEEPINMAEYEDFSTEPYEDDPPMPTAEVVHDVPEDLLEGKLDQGPVSRTGSGFRIQIYSSQDKRAADRRAEQAVAWWREQIRTGRLGEVYPDETSPPPVYQDFRQPYYRVRMGNFRSNAEAQETLRIVERRFPNAFLVPARVTLSR